MNLTQLSFSANAVLTAVAVRVDVCRSKREPQHGRKKQVFRRKRLMKVEMQFFGYFFSASAKKVRELKIISILHSLKCWDKLNYSSTRFSYDPLKHLIFGLKTPGNSWTSIWSYKKTMGLLLCHDQKIYETCFGRCRINFYLLKFAPDFQFDW